MSTSKRALDALLADAASHSARNSAIDAELDEYFSGCDCLALTLRQEAQRMSLARSATASPRGSLSLCSREPRPPKRLDDVRGSASHLWRLNKVALAREELEEAMKLPPSPRRGHVVSSPTARAWRRPTSAARPTRRSSLCNNESALENLRASAPKLANFFLQAAAEQPAHRPVMRPRPSSANREYGPTAGFHGIRPRTRSELAPPRETSLTALRRMLEGDEL